jgi:short-subunit dehydrogenase
VLPEMLERGRGHLAAICSLAGYKGMPSHSGYCASKAAVRVYMEGLRIQLRQRGIAVTTICPGVILTAMLDAYDELPKLWPMEADTAARKIIRALTRRRKVYNFPWQASLFIGLTQWLPDWVLARAMENFDLEGPRPIGKKPGRNKG